MKIRTGYVSNSSTTSFVIAKSELTEAQIGGLLGADGLAHINDDGVNISGASVRYCEDIAHKIMDDLSIPEGIIEWGF